MPIHDFASQRLFVDHQLGEAISVPLDRGQANYLVSVLRMRSDDEILVFNGVDGEWRARLVVQGRKSAVLEPIEQVRAQPRPTALHYLFAPLKQARLDYMIQKAVEMGVSTLQPVLTKRCQIGRVNQERMRANVIEAAEQCGVLGLPAIRSALALTSVLSALDPHSLLVFCDEDSPVADPVQALGSHRNGLADCALLIGPEGGFSPGERDLLLARPNLVRLSLGPRILRADTAAVAALAVIQATLGDWR